MDPVVLVVFVLVYLGMMAGKVRGLAIDRTGIALLGAITLVASGRLSLEQAWASVDVPTLALLFGLMIVSVQFRLGGFYAASTRWVAERRVTPPVLLGGVLALAGGLSALLANDIVCLAMAPILVEACARRRLDPVPFLLGLACASNVGSAATLIGNPQNMLIGQVLGLSFGGYFLVAAPPAAIGLVLTWWVIVSITRGRWERGESVPLIEAPEYNRRQTVKGLVVLGLLTAAFLWGAWPREVVALCAAGVLLLSRRLASRRMIGFVDGQLLVLFIALFVVNAGMRESGMLEEGVAGLSRAGIDLHQPGWLFTASVILSNLVSNVPATMLLLPLATHPLAGPILALGSTLAGNLLLVGSIANLIVVDQAATLGIRITWKDHARVGVPVAVLTLLTAAIWLVGAARLSNP